MCQLGSDRRLPDAALHVYETHDHRHQQRFVSLLRCLSRYLPIVSVKTAPYHAPRRTTRHVAVWRGHWVGTDWRSGAFKCGCGTGAWAGTGQCSPVPALCRVKPFERPTRVSVRGVVAPAPEPRRLPPQTSPRSPADTHAGPPVLAQPLQVPSQHPRRRFRCPRSLRQHQEPQDELRESAAARLA